VRFPRTLARVVSIVLAPALLICSTAHTTRAAMVATQQVLQTSAPSEARARLQAFLDREDVQRVLERWGVSPAEAKSRVDALSDSEVAGVAGRLDSLPAGGDGTVGIIVGAVLLVFFVLLITDLLGLTDVFPFIKKRHR